MHWLGWASSGLLALTIAYQVFRHWRSADNGGVSPLLYIGQAAASTGFLAYSWALGNWVFAVTNVVLLLTAFCGVAIHWRHAHRARGRDRAPSP